MLETRRSRFPTPAGWSCFPGAVLLHALLLIGPGLAQPRMGDLIIAGADTLVDGHIKVVDGTGKISTLSKIVRSFPTTVDMDFDNTHLMIGLGLPPYQLMRISPGGAITTLMNLYHLTHQFSPDQNGDYIAYAGNTSGLLLRIKLRNPGSTTLLTHAWVPSAGAMDLDTGTLFHGRRSPVPNSICRYDPTRNTATTVVTDIGDTPTCMVSDPETGEVLVTVSGQSGRVLGVKPNGSFTTLFQAPYARCIRAAQDNTLWVLMQHGSFGTLSRYDRTGKALRTFQFFSLMGSYGLEIYGSRPLSGTGSTRGGASYTLNISLPPSWAAGKAFVLVASTRPRPSLPLPNGENLYLMFDSLLVFSLLGAIPNFLGFQGVLNANGQATAKLIVPPGISGARLYFSGVLIDTQAPGTIGKVFNTHGITFE